MRRVAGYTQGGAGDAGSGICLAKKNVPLVISQIASTLGGREYPSSG